ncbi:hypothetical protein [Streptomyces phaeoluteigriseus]
MTTRQEVDGAEEVDAPYLGVDQQRQDQGEAGLERDDDGGEVRRVAQGLVEDRVFEELGEVPQADEAGRGGRDEPRVGERQGEGEDDRYDEEDDQQHDGRGGHGEGGEALTATGVVRSGSPDRAQLFGGCDLGGHGISREPVRFGRHGRGPEPDRGGSA